MRRLVVALFALVLVLATAGCGGGGEETAQTGSASTGAAAAPAGGGGSSTSTLPDLANGSENETTTFAPFPTTEDIPTDVVYKITVEKQPTLVYFYDSTQNASKEVRRVIDEVRADNRGLVDLVAYDIGRYIKANQDGSVEVDPSFATDPAAKAAIQFARNPVIGVSFTPFVLVTDGQGYIIFKHRGLIDRKFLEREVLRAAR